MGSIYEKGGYLYISYYIDGKRKRESLNLPANRINRKIAKELKLEKERDISLPKQVIRKKLTIDESIKKFERYNFDKAKSTKAIYSTILDYFKVYFGGSKEIKNITNDDILELREYLSSIVSKVSKDKLSQNSIASYFRHLKAFFNWAIDNGFYNEKNPVPRLREGERPIVTIPDDHFLIVLSYLRGDSVKKWRVIKMLQLSGRRVNDVLSLRWENCDFENRVINTLNKKANREELIPMHNKMYEFLSEFRKPKGKMFNYANSNSLKFWKRALTKLELPLYSLHSIRKTFATNLVRRNVPILDASKHLGHSNVKVTAKFYARVDVSKLNSQLDDMFEGS